MVLPYNANRNWKYDANSKIRPNTYDALKGCGNYKAVPLLVINNSKPINNSIPLTLTCGY